jgi:hypothetical protein
MIDDVSLLAGICLGLALWVLRLKTKLVKAEEFGFMALMALRDVADNKVQITRDENGDITLKKLSGVNK